MEKGKGGAGLIKGPYESVMSFYGSARHPKPQRQPNFHTSTRRNYGLELRALGIAVHFVDTRDSDRREVRSIR